MPTRKLVIDGDSWEVRPTGFVTQYDADECGIAFVRRSGTSYEMRVTRFCPDRRGTDAAIAACDDAALRELFARTQPTDTAPEGGYQL
ncbi:MAG: hypothetical protein FJ202_09705 [Gemmatimonadetes bacterium]|nr:hypothetical protein [Gemmatimonadota bacterium]